MRSMLSKLKEGYIVRLQPKDGSEGKFGIVTHITELDGDSIWLAFLDENGIPHSSAIGWYEPNGGSAYFLTPTNMCMVPRSKSWLIDLSHRMRGLDAE